MDVHDAAILEVLQKNGRESFAEIGAQVGLSASACHKRVKMMEEVGIIDRYVAIVSPDKVKLKTSIYVQATLKNQTQETLKAFEHAVQQHNEIMECYLMAGLSDYLLRVVCADAADFEHIHNEVLLKLPGIERVASNFTIRKVLRRTALPIKAGKAKASSSI